MDERETPTAWKRLAGRFRRMAVTELGEEQQCASCGELWPFDREFFMVSHGRVGCECRACAQERKAAGKPAVVPAQAGTR